MGLESWAKIREALPEIAASGHNGGLTMFRLFDKVKWARRMLHRAIYEYLMARSGSLELLGVDPPTRVRLERIK